jgi:hypothetical protein
MIRRAHPLLSTVFYFFLFVCTLRAGAGSYLFDFNAECRKAYQEIIKLKLIPAGKCWRQKKSASYNLIPYFLDNYIDFFTLFFNEDPAEYRRRKPFLEQRLALMKKEILPPLLSFYRSVIYFQWAAVEIKFGERWDAAWSFRDLF